MTKLRVVAFWMGVAAVLTGCGDGSGSRGAQAAERAPTHVDSIFPIEEEIRRFREALGAEPTALRGGSTSRDGLVHAFVTGLERSDTAGLRDLAITPEEFGYLYYPHTHYVSKPYELSPALVWFQLENYGNRGLQRAMRRFGGEPLGMSGYRCADEPRVQGPNRIWEDCVIDRGRGNEELLPLSLFGAILEREGRYKFVSYANRLSS